MAATGRSLLLLLTEHLAGQASSGRAIISSPKSPRLSASYTPEVRLPRETLPPPGAASSVKVKKGSMAHSRAAPPRSSPYQQASAPSS